MEINNIDSLEGFMDAMEDFGADTMSVTFDVKRNPYELSLIHI